ncbi:PEBP-like protein [Xylariomycetidae sp. FL2044]|nr:PEBP-like protein [Xylariomycetidae sp. FL2044]
MYAIIEVIFAYLFKNAKARDAKAFFTHPAFSLSSPSSSPSSSSSSSHKPRPQTINVSSPDCGPSGSTLSVEYTADGAGRFPALTWELETKTKTKTTAEKGGEEEVEGGEEEEKEEEEEEEVVKEWLIVSEDPDAPLPTPICHGIYTGIPAAKTSVEAGDFEEVVADPGRALALMKGGFHYGRSMRGVPYIPPRPLMNHGPHRYFFIVVALNEPLGAELLTAQTTREQIADAIVGKVIGWGMWTGVAERKWR